MTTARRGLKIKVIGPGRAGFKGGQTGQLPRASTTKGLQRKTVKKLLPKKNIKILFETYNLGQKIACRS